MEINGIAHLFLTVSDYESARPFYEKLRTFLGMKTVLDGDERGREDVDSFHRFLVDDLGALIVHPPEDGAWAPGYYSVLFEDPDGIRLEMNHVPGRGLLADDAGG